MLYTGKGHQISEMKKLKVSGLQTYTLGNFRLWRNKGTVFVVTTRKKEQEPLVESTTTVDDMHLGRSSA